MLIKKIRNLLVLIISLFGSGFLFSSEIKTSTDSLISKKDQVNNKELTCKLITNLTGLTPDLIKIIADCLGFELINTYNLSDLVESTKANIQIEYKLKGLEYTPDGKQVGILLEIKKTEDRYYTRTSDKLFIINLEENTAQEIATPSDIKLIKFLSSKIIAYSSKQCYVPGDTAVIDLFDIENLKKLSKFESADPYSNLLKLNSTQSGSELVSLLGGTISSTETIIKIWDIKSGALKRVFNYPGYSLCFNKNLLIAFKLDPDQNGTSELKIRVGDLDKGLDANIFKTISREANRFELAIKRFELQILNNKQVLIFEYNNLRSHRPCSISILDLTNKEVINIANFTSFTSPGSILCKSIFAFSVDGKYMAAEPYGKAGENNVKIFDLQSHLVQSKIIKELGQIENGKSEICSIIFSPDSKNLIIAFHDRILVFRNNYKCLLY